MRESNGTSWQIEQQCPQCGAPLVLEETDRVLSCSYCRVKVYISFPGHARFYIPCDASLHDVQYVPYWRFKGTLFSCTENEIQSRIVDSNHAAAASGAFPPSLGVRPQVLRMRFAAPRPDGSFLKPDLPLKLFSLTIDDTFKGISEVDTPGRCEAFIGEAVSLVYAPFFVRENTLYDAVLKRPAPVPDGKCSLEFTPDPAFDWPMSFIPTLCPHCGWDLEGRRDSLVLLCRNCASGWVHSQGGFDRVRLAFLPPDEGSSLFLPFWHIRARFEGIGLDTYGDLAHLANMPRAGRTPDDARPLYFLVPAFKIQPQSFLRLAKMATTFQPRERAQETLPEIPLHPVTLPSTEAAESIKTLLAMMAVPKRTFFPLLSKIRVILEEALLFYYPFNLMGNEYVQPGLQTTVNRNALGWGRLM